MAVTFNKGKSYEITLRVVLESEEYGCDYFDHHDTVNEMLASIRNIVLSAPHDGCERLVGIAMVPVGGYGNEEGYGFGLNTDTDNFA